MSEDEKEFSDVLNNIKVLTFGQILQIVKKLKYTTLVWGITIFTSCIGGTYTAGQYEENKSVGVTLDSPFAMRLGINSDSYEFSRLTLIRDPTASSAYPGKVILSIREIKNEFDIVPIGKIVATAQEKELKGIWKWLLSETRSVVLAPSAHAENTTMVFIWNGHLGDYDFKEEFVQEYLVHRYYQDGCVLSYEVDESRRSKPETFTWVEIAH